MKRAVSIIAIIIILAFGALQFVRTDMAVPPVVDSETLGSSINVPPEVQQILERSCSDCHSNATRYPWYARVQPVGWFLSGHITNGRQHLNLSTFSTYTTQRKEQKLDQMCEEVQSREMPLPSYLWIHWDAKMSDADIQTLCAWTRAAQTELAGD